MCGWGGCLPPPSHLHPLCRVQVTARAATRMRHPRMGALQSCAAAERPVASGCEGGLRLCLCRISGSVPTGTAPFVGMFGEAPRCASARCHNSQQAQLSCRRGGAVCCEADRGGNIGMHGTGCDSALHGTISAGVCRVSTGKAGQQASGLHCSCSGGGRTQAAAVAPCCAAGPGQLVATMG